MSVLLLGGPTAAGKSDLAVELAEQHDAVLVSADAMTVYRGLDVGTAKPSPEILARHPHACINVREVGEAFAVADFVDAVDHALRRHPRVIVVGGTPF
ncbi:MAG: isopentenyl transferase family protein, partial [Myxococcota bacterium]|nr:isopentenyl transferase family protein [Myxococcota bacterium]